MRGTQSFGDIARRATRGRRRRGAFVVAALAAGAVTALVAATVASGDAATSAATLTPKPRPSVVGSSGSIHLQGGVTLPSSPDTSWWGTNGRVMDMTMMGNRVYLGGSFDYIGPNTGYGSILTGSTGTLSPGSQTISGTVRAVLSDGAGGWYVGGDFQRIGTTFQPSLAHINADGTLANWKPVPKGSVYALAMLGGNLLVGGEFTEIGGTPATNIALISTATGAQVPGWTATTDGIVQAITVSAARVFLGGAFTKVDGVAHRGLAAVSGADGSLDASFAGTVAGTAYALAVDATSGQLFVGGGFSTVSLGASTVPRSSIASFNVTGNALNSFAPVADSSVYALALDGAGYLYAGGSFTSFGGSTNNGIAKVSTGGVVAPFAARIIGCHGTHGTGYTYEFYPCVTQVDALDISGGTLYAGGLFSNAAGQVRHNAAAYTLATGALSSWDPRPGNLVRSLAGSGGNVFLGGDLTSVNGLLRTGLAALDATTGAGDPTFTANTNQTVVTLQPSAGGTRLYAGGTFTSIQGQTRKYLAAIMVATGLLDPGFTPAFNDSVLDMDVVGYTLYAGGKFTTVNGASHAHAVKLSSATGGIYTSWKTSTSGPAGALLAGGMVQGIQVAPDGSKVYLAGPFTSVSGTAVKGGIAVVTGSTGALTSRQLGGVTGCSIGAFLNRLYLSPDGKRLYGGGLCPDKIYQWDAVNLSTYKANGLNWVTVCNAGMQGRIEVNGHFYYGSHGGDLGAGGWCALAPGDVKVTQQRFFAFRSSDGVLDPFRPDFDTAMGIWSFAVVPGRGLLVGGDFAFAGDSQTVAHGVAFFPGTP